MTTSVNGTLGLVSVDASTLSGTVAGYLVSFTEAGGAVIPSPVAVVLDATSFSIALDVGTWTASAVAVDATAAALSAPVVSAPLVLSAPVTVMVSVPGSVTLAVAA